MKQKRHSVDEVIGKLRLADVDLGKGKTVPKVCRIMEKSVQTDCRWRQKYGGMNPEMAKELKALQKENGRLKKLLAGQALDMEFLERSCEGKLLGPEHLRRTVKEIRRRLRPVRVSKRLVCRVLGHSRTQRYQPKPDEASRRLLTQQHPRYGVPRIHPELVAEGWRVNRK